MFLEATFPTTVLLTLQKHEQKLLVANERVLLPEAAIQVENKKAVNRISEEIAENSRAIRALEAKNAEAYRRREDLRHPTKPSANAPHRKLIKCPLEDCRGFLAAGLCGVCNRRVCMKCFKEKSDVEDDAGNSGELTRPHQASSSSSSSSSGNDAKPKHECLPEDLANAEYLRENTKACPCCGVRTSKVSGCDQML